MPAHNDSKEQSRQRFNRLAQAYVDSVSHAKGEDLEILRQMADPQADWHALDVATGGGHTALVLAPHVTQVIATDIAARMLEKASAFTAQKGVENIVFQFADAESLPFDAEIFDLVTCRIAPHHFPDCARFVKECSRVAKKGGRVVIQDHVLPETKTDALYIDAFERLRDPSHHRAYSQTEWLEMFESAALAIEETREIAKRHAFKGWVERQGCTTETIDELYRLLREASPIVADWMQPINIGKEDASFVGHHILIAGHKMA